MEYFSECNSSEKNQRYIIKLENLITKKTLVCRRQKKVSQLKLREMQLQEPLDACYDLI